MAFYQVLLSLASDREKLRSVLTDLTEKELKTRFLSPYKKGKNIVCGNEIIPVQQINKLHIVYTVQKDEVERNAMFIKSIQEIERFHQQNNRFTLISPGRGFDPEDILEVGEDVTSKYIISPPGDRTAASLIISNPWIVAIGAGLIVIVLTTWLGLSSGPAVRVPLNTAPIQTESPKLNHFSVQLPKVSKTVSKPERKLSDISPKAR